MLKRQGVFRAGIQIYSIYMFLSVCIIYIKVLNWGTTWYNVERTQQKYTVVVQWYSDTVICRNTLWAPVGHTAWLLLMAASSTACHILADKRCFLFIIVFFVRGSIYPIRGNPHPHPPLHLDESSFESSRIHFIQLSERIQLPQSGGASNWLFRSAVLISTGLTGQSRRRSNMRSGE